METTIINTHSRLFFFLKAIKHRWSIIILFLSLIFAVHKSHATHMMGADITYRCIEPLKFEITLKWYRDCRGIPLNRGGNLTIRCTTGGPKQKLGNLKISCRNTFILDTLGSQNGIPGQIQSQWNDKNDAPICLIDNMRNHVSFILVLAPQNGSASMYSSTGGRLSKRMMQGILSLKKGDTILIERLEGTDPYDQGRKRYPSVNFKLK